MPAAMGGDAHVRRRLTDDGIFWGMVIAVALAGLCVLMWAVFS